MTDGGHLRGSAEQCPKCGTRRVYADPEKTIGGYGTGLAACPDCRVLWEPLDPAQLWDPDDPLCAFAEPCNNCAFRPGSPEQQDREGWRTLIASLKAGGEFFCHKGVPIEAGAEHGFAYPTTADGTPDIARLRHCRGYLNMLPALLKAWERGHDTTPTPSCPGSSGASTPSGAGGDPTPP